MKLKTSIVDFMKADAKNLKILLETSDFHPAGGGQPGDSGTILADSFQGEIIDTITEQRGKFHLTRVKKGTPVRGLEVEIEVDEERHGILTKMHSAQHLISRILENNHKGMHTTKANIDEKESTIYFSYDEDFNWDMIFETEDSVNAVIGEDRNVTSSFLSPEEARYMEGLTAKWDRLPGKDPIQVIHVEDFDITACSGTHVHSTGQIPHIIITNYKGSSPDWEIKFSLSREELQTSHSRIIRKFSKNIGCPPEKLEKTYTKLQSDNKGQRKMIEKLRHLIEIPWEITEIGQSNMYFAILPGFTKDLVMSAAKKRLINNPEAIVFTLMPSEDTLPSGFLLLQGEKKNIDLKKLIQLPELQAHGGGDGRMLSGVTRCNSINTWKVALLNYY